MKLSSMSIENFLSFGPAVTLPLANLGLVLVDGDNKSDPTAMSNGAGKSALLEALVWGLFGRTLRGLTGDAVINRTTKSDCVVKLTGEHEGKTWHLARGRKADVALEFKVDGKILGAPNDTRETQKAIEHTLGISYDVFTNTSIFGQGNKWRFTELNDDARKAIFNRILGTGRLESALDVAKSQRKEVAREVDELTAERDSLAQQIENYSGTIRDALRAAREQHEQDLAEAESLLTAAKGELRKAQKPTGALEARIKAATKDLQELNDRSEALKAALEKRQRESANAEAQIGVAQSRLEDAEKAYDFSTRAGANICRACGSKIDQATKDHHVLQLKRALDTAANARVRAVEARNDAEKAERSAKSKYQDSGKGASVVERRLNDAQQELRETENVRRMEEHKVELCEAELERIRKAPPKAPAIDRLKEARATCARSAKDAEEKLEDLRPKLEMLDFWVTGFGNGGVRSHILDFVTPLLNDRVRAYASALMPDLDIEFETQKHLKSGEVRDKFDIAVTNAHGAEGYAGNSGGEKRKVDIIIARAIQALEEDRSQGINVAWWDEVFESLDEKSCERVMSFLRKEAESKSTVFVISHLEWLKPHFPKTLTVVKDEFSKLVWDR